MNQFQSHKSGFMFIEVVMAITIMSISITALINLQANIINKVWQEHGYLEHLFKMQTLFWSPELSKLINSGYEGVRFFEQKNTTSFNELKYLVEPVKAKSDVFAKFPDLYLMNATGSWNGAGMNYANHTDSLLSLVYIAPVLKSEEDRK